MMAERKFLYVPEATNDVVVLGEPDLQRQTAAAVPEHPEQAPTEEPAGTYPCPCCGCLTLPCPAEEAIAWICPVCFWENDVFLQSDDEPSDENHGMTLRTARENFRRYRAMDPRFRDKVRAPYPQEIPPCGTSGK